MAHRFSTPRIYRFAILAFGWPAEQRPDQRNDKTIHRRFIKRGPVIYNEVGKCRTEDNPNPAPIPLQITQPQGFFITFMLLHIMFFFLEKSKCKKHPSKSHNEREQIEYVFHAGSYGNKGCRERVLFKQKDKNA